MENNILVSVDQKTHNKIRNKFKKSWRSKKIGTRVKNIYRINNPILQTGFLQEKGRMLANNGNDSKERRLWHGTSLTCNLENSRTPCHNPDCAVCSIIVNGFNMKYADDDGWYGKGIYFAKSSSKSAKYCKTRTSPVLILAYVELGNTKKTNKKRKGKGRPKKHDSITAKARDKAKSESVIFTGKQSSPGYLVFYDTFKKS